MRSGPLESTDLRSSCFESHADAASLARARSPTSA
eukprot:CAMPEP_0113230840 /NCGR_PEP_ID=MMETSP0008_2-20120614/1102_1 /TAXON_ID=97485 /ORGANISM="Prymnesium parvum" /LENGTH=34 /DNA_ID=CAMNT_0000077457 /DNA_START=688 /DNA_END=788 /DNA_ORIENTATION=- /assembly_acc=CAM_ASM_000153